MCDWYREVVQTYSETYGLKVDPHMDLIVANLLCGELRYVPGISPSSVPMGLFRPIGTIVQLLPDSDVLHVKVCCF